MYQFILLDLPFIRVFIFFNVSRFVWFLFCPVIILSLFSEMIRFTRNSVFQFFLKHTKIKVDVVAHICNSSTQKTSSSRPPAPYPEFKRGLSYMVG